MRAATWKALPRFVLSEARISRRPDGIVRVPYCDDLGRERNAKLFAPQGRTWWERAGVGLMPFGLESLADPPTDRALLIAEGESDALALRAVFGWGYDVLGIPGANTWRLEWLRYLQPYGIVYVLGDGDEAGDRLISSVRSDRPDARAVRLPDGEDARSLIQGTGADDLFALLEAADHEAAERQDLLRIGEAITRSRTLPECQEMLLGEAVLDRAA